MRGISPRRVAALSQFTQAPSPRIFPLYAHAFTQSACIYTNTIATSANTSATEDHVTCHPWQLLKHTEREVADWQRMCYTIKL